MMSTLSDNAVDLSDNAVDLSDLYVDYSDILSTWHELGKNPFLIFIF